MQSKTEEVKRKKYLEYLTNYLGNVEEKEDKVMCYIDIKKLDVYNYKEDNGKNGKYVIRCSRPNYNEEYKDYKLDKSVCFILDDLVFYEKVEIDGENEIIINNCYFRDGLNINFNGKCLLSGNKIAGYDYNNHPKELSITAKELVLKNNEILLSDVLPHDVLPHIDLRANNSLAIINNDIVGNNVSLNASNVNIIDSKIIYKDINCIPETLTMDDSSFLHVLNDEEIIHSLVKKK